MSQPSFKGLVATFEASPIVVGTYGISSMPVVAANVPPDLLGTDWPTDADILESYLEPTVIEFTERTSSIEGDLRVSPIDITVHDKRCTSGPMIGKRPMTWLGTRTPTAIGYTQLAQSISAAEDTHFYVTNGSKLGTFPRVLYVEEEAISCSAIDTGTGEVTIDRRGYYGTATRAHLIGIASTDIPIVFKDFPTFYGRKCVLWLVDNANFATPFYRGYVKNMHANGKQTAYTFSLEHLWQRERERPLGIPSVSTNLRGVDPTEITWEVSNPGTFEASTFGRRLSVRSTTIAAGSNGVALPTGTIHIASTAGLPNAGSVSIQISTGPPVWSLVSYTGANASAGTLTGCSGGSGTMATGDVVRGSGVGDVSNTLHEACGIVTRDMVSYLSGAAFFNGSAFTAVVDCDNESTFFTLTCARGLLASPTVGLSLRGSQSEFSTATDGNASDPRVQTARVQEAPSVLWRFRPSDGPRAYPVSSVEGLPTTWTDGVQFELGDRTSARYILRGQVSDGVNLNCEPDSSGTGSSGPFIVGQWSFDGPNVPVGVNHPIWVTAPIALSVQILIESSHWAYAVWRGIIESTGAIQSGIDAASWDWSRIQEVVRLTSGGPVSRLLYLDGTTTLDHLLGDACKLSGCGVGIGTGGRMSLFAFHPPLATDVVTLSVSMDDHQEEPSGATMPEGVVNIVSVRGSNVTIVVNDKTSQGLYGPSRPVDVALDGGSGLAASNAPAQQIVGYIGERLLGLWDRPVGTARVNTTIANLIDTTGAKIGNMLEVTEYSVPDGLGERGLTAARGQINERKVRIDPTGESLSFVEYEALMYPHTGLAGYAPAALVASVDGTKKILTLATGYLTESGTATDGAGSNQETYPFAPAVQNDGGASWFVAGDALRVRETDAVSPIADEFVTVTGTSPATPSVSVNPALSPAMAAAVAAGRCRIGYANYDDCQASQRLFAFVADFADDAIGTADDPSRKFAP